MVVMMMLILNKNSYAEKAFTHIQAQMLLHTSPVTHTHAGASKQNFDTGACVYTEAFTHRSSYTQQQHTHTHGCLLQTDSFSLRADACTQVLSHTHTGSFTRRSFYTPALSHTGTFTHRSFYTHTHKHTHTHTMIVAADAFTHGSSDTHTHTPKKKYTQKTFHAEAFTCRCFCTQKAFARKPIYTKVPLRTDVFTQNALAHRWGHTLLRTDAWRHRRLYTQKLCTQTGLHRERLYTHC